MLPEPCPDCSQFDLCCTTLYDGARNLLEAAWAAFAACATPEACAPVGRFVALAEPHLATQDYLAVWIDSVTLPTKTTTPRPKDFFVQQPTVAYGVKLVERGAPVLEQVGTEIQEPAPSSIDQAAMFSLSHAEALYTGVLNYAIQSGPCGIFQGHSALRPSLGGGLVGWAFNVSFEAKWH